MLHLNHIFCKHRMWSAKRKEKKAHKQKKKRDLIQITAALFDYKVRHILLLVVKYLKSISVEEDKGEERYQKNDIIDNNFI